MSRIIAETNISKVLCKFSSDQIQLIVDHVIDYNQMVSIRRGHEEVMLATLDPNVDAFEIIWPFRQHQLGLLGNNRPVQLLLYFFAASEQEVIDRLSVAEIMLL